MHARHLTAMVMAAGMVGALAACASGGPGLFDRSVGADHVHGDAVGATITGLGSVPEALPLAIGHCSHFGKSAQYARREGDSFVFRCVAR